MSPQGSAQRQSAVYPGLRLRSALLPPQTEMQLRRRSPKVTVLRRVGRDRSGVSLNLVKYRQETQEISRGQAVSETGRGCPFPGSSRECVSVVLCSLCHKTVKRSTLGEREQTKTSNKTKLA